MYLPPGGGKAWPCEHSQGPAREPAGLPTQVLGADRSGYRALGSLLSLQIPQPLQRLTFPEERKYGSLGCPLLPRLLSFSFMFKLYHVAHGTLVPQPGIGPCSLLWKHRLITTGPPGASGRSPACSPNPCLKSVPVSLTCSQSTLPFQGG